MTESQMSRRSVQFFSNLNSQILAIGFRRIVQYGVKLANPEIFSLMWQNMCKHIGN